MSLIEYKIEIDNIHPNMYYLYEHTENAIRLRLVVYNDFELAKRILEELNSGVNKE